MEPTDPKFNPDDERYAFVGNWLDELIPTIGGAIIACVLGILVLIAIGMTGCSREAWQGFAQGYSEAHERNWGGEQWNAPARVQGNHVYDSAGRRGMILPNGTVAPGPARVQTDAFGNTRMIDSSGRMHLVR